MKRFFRTAIGTLVAVAMMLSSCVFSVGVYADESDVKITESKDYSVYKAKSGMYREFETPELTFRITLVSCKTEWVEYRGVDTVVDFEYTLIPKVDINGLGISRDLDPLKQWEDSTGVTYDEGLGYGQVQAGVVYTCRDRVSYLSDLGISSVSVWLLAHDPNIDITPGFTFCIVPPKPIVKPGENLLTTDSTINVSHGYGSSFIVYYKEKKASKWKEYYSNSVGVAEVVNLKPNKEYMVKVRAYDKGCDLDYNAWGLDVYSPFTKTFTVKTGLSSGPEVKSISVSKAKVKETVEYGNYYNTTSYTTKFKVTVKLKRKPGKAKGMIFVINDREYKVKGSKTTYTFDAECDGNIVDQTISVKCMSYNDKTGTGTSPEVVIDNVKVKK